MKIFIGADHRGFELRQKLIDHLNSSGFTAIDEGDSQLKADDDFPQFADKVAKAVLSSKDGDPRGILICGNGQGMCIAANRFKGIRAGLGYNIHAAHQIRVEDDTNILCLPADLLAQDQAYSIVDMWLTTPFDDVERRQRRKQELDRLGN